MKMEKFIAITLLIIVSGCIEQSSSRTDVVQELLKAQAEADARSRELSLSQEAVQAQAERERLPILLGKATTIKGVDDVFVEFYGSRSHLAASEYGNQLVKKRKTELRQEYVNKHPDLSLTIKDAILKGSITLDDKGTGNCKLGRYL
jgi:hypothetical protein